MSGLTLSFKKIGMLAMGGMVLSGCFMVGPDFHSPCSPNPASLTETPLSKKTVRTPGAGKAGRAQTLVKGGYIRSDWWVLFHSPKLNQLICLGLNNSPTIVAAYAALRAAQEALTAQIGNSMAPAFNDTGYVSRQLESGIAFGINNPVSVFNLFNTQLNVTYTLDVFGGARRQIEALRAQVDYQQFQLIAAQIALTANIVTTAVTIASLQAQIAATHKLDYFQTKQLNIMWKQYRLGGIALDIVMTQKTLVEQTRATLPGLEKNLAAQRHVLSALIGQLPNEPLPAISLDDLHLPTRLPVSVPSLIVRQRPDVRAAEATLHAASAQVGVATANLLPSFPITGNFGWLADVPGHLFKPFAEVWQEMLAYSIPVFHGGALFAARRQAIDLWQQSYAQYRQAVLTAFQNIADTLRAIELDAKNLRDQKTAENAAYANLKLAEDQYFLGGANYIFLLNAQRQFQTIHLQVIQAKALRYTDTAALFQAVGGGWWHQNWCIKESLHAA